MGIYITMANSFLKLLAGLSVPLLIVPFVLIFPLSAYSHDYRYKCLYPLPSGQPRHAGSHKKQFIYIKHLNKSLVFPLCFSHPGHSDHNFSILHPVPSCHTQYSPHTKAFLYKNTLLPKTYCHTRGKV